MAFAGRCLPEAGGHAARLALVRPLSSTTGHSANILAAAINNFACNALSLPSSWRLSVKSLSSCAALLATLSAS
eukprot:3664871-Heterocapsa_arctica.AAC.1